MKKIALCLSGYFNSSRDKSSLGIDGYDHIHRQILSRGDVDVYIHSWDFHNRETIERLYGNLIKNSIFEKQIDFKPIYFENGLDSHPHRKGTTPFWNVFSQFYSVQKSFELLYESGNNYDCVIKSRFDLGRINRHTSGPGLGNPYPVQCINFDENLDMDYFYLADWQYFETEGPPDMWFYSSQKNMKEFTKIFDLLSSDMKINSDFQNWAGANDGGLLNNIKGWKWFLIKTGLWEKKLPLQTYWE